MDHVVAVIQPFIMEQEVSVYKGNECIEVQHCSLRDLENACYALCKKHDIHQLELYGNQLYSLHIKDNLKMDKYAKFNLDINII